MDFREIEDVRKFCRETGFVFSTQHDRVLETALTPEVIDDIFKWVTQYTKRPLLYEIGCSRGYTTAQIAQRLREKGVKDYRLIACDIDPRSVSWASEKFSADERITVELRNGLDYSEIESDSVDGIFSFNVMLPFLEHCLINGRRLHRVFLNESSRVLKEGKPLVLTWLWKPLILIKDKRMSGIPFQLKLYRPHKSIEPFLQILKEEKNERKSN